MRILLIVFVVVSLFISGCATAPSSQQILSADYGATPGNWEKITKETLAKEMVRPDSLYIRKIDPPVKAWIVTPNGETLYGWGVCGLVVMGVSNLEPFFVLIKNDDPVYELLGFRLAKRIPGQTWIRNGVFGRTYDDFCPNLFKQ